jgi:hypothetical protein
VPTLTPRRLLVVAVAACLLVALAVRGWPDDPGPQRPMPPVERGPGAAMVAGLRVPPGAVLLGRAVPVDDARTRAYLRVTGDPALVWTALLTELVRTGHRVHLTAGGAGGCSPLHPAPDGVPTHAVNLLRPPPAGTPPQWIGCGVVARPGDPERANETVRAELLVGGGTGEHAANHVTVTVASPERRYILPEGPGDRVVPVGFTVPLPPAPPLPGPGGSWLSRSGGDEFELVPGSHLLMLRTDAGGVGDWAQCSAGSFEAVLAITGDVVAGHDAYADQVPGADLFGTRTDDAWLAGADRVRRTELHRPILLSAEGTYFAMRSVTSPRGESYAVIEYCRE